MNLRPTRPWEFNILNIYNYNIDGPYSFIFDFLKKNQSRLKGDILEAGVYRGRMTLALGLFLLQNNLPGTVQGFDTFNGFPSASSNDNFEKFEELFLNSRITQKHYDQVRRLVKYNELILNRGLDPFEISSSGNFKDSKYTELLQKIEALDLENIVLHSGEFSRTMTSQTVEALKYSVIFIDCDLFDGYMHTLRHGWDRLLPGGIIFLDEYYSLKFPGARMAVDEFIAEKRGYV
jgi:hypothetical protein